MATGRAMAGHAHGDADVWIRALGIRIRVTCPDARLREVITANFEAMREDAARGPAKLHYRVLRAPAGVRLAAGATTLHAADDGELLYLLEKEITLSLQRIRSHLLFLHAAALERVGGAWLFAGDSGAGKSTTAWALLEHGCGYLSDELSPVDLQALEVHPYPHALCLKQAPPAPYALPDRIVDLGATLHLPPSTFRAATHTRATPLAGLVLIESRASNAAPSLRRLTTAESAARLYAISLNLLAHPQRGLEAVLRLAARLPCFALKVGELGSTCAQLLGIMQHTEQLGTTRPAENLPAASQAGPAPKTRV